MKAFTVVMTIDSPFAEGFVALVCKKGEHGAKRDTSLFIGPESDGFNIFSAQGDMEKEIRKNPHCKEVKVSDTLWEAARSYQKKRKDSAKALKKALGPELETFIFLGGAVIGHKKENKKDKGRQK